MGRSGDLGRLGSSSRDVTRAEPVWAGPVWAGSLVPCAGPLRSTPPDLHLGARCLLLRYGDTNLENAVAIAGPDVVLADTGGKRDHAGEGAIAELSTPVVPLFDPLFLAA